MIWNLLQRQSSTPMIPAAELATKLTAGEALTLIDVREPSEFRQGHIPEARLIPLGQLAERIGEIPREQPVYVICRSGNRSNSAVRQLTAAGIQAINVAGGMLRYPGPVAR